MQPNSLYKIQDTAETVAAQDVRSGFVRQSDRGQANAQCQHMFVMIVTSYGMGAFLRLHFLWGSSGVTVAAKEDASRARLERQEKPR